MSKKPNVFGQAALVAYKKRQARTGIIECFSPGSPLVEAAKEDPDSCALDLEWLDKTLTSIPKQRLACLHELLRVFDDRPGAHRMAALYWLLKDAEARGFLATFQKPTEGPAPRPMTEAEVARTREYLAHHPVPADFKLWEFPDEAALEPGDQK